MNTRICPECGAEFRPRYGSQVCCSEECKLVRKQRQNREHHARCQSKPKAADTERKEKARRRAEFFAARDAAFEKAGQPVPRIEERDGRVIETRGQVCAGWRSSNRVSHNG